MSRNFDKMLPPAGLGDGMLPPAGLGDGMVPLAGLGDWQREVRLSQDSLASFRLVSILTDVGPTSDVAPKSKIRFLHTCQWRAAFDDSLAFLL